MSRAALACLFGLHLPNSTGCSMKVSVSVSSLELCVGSTAFLWGLHTGSGAALRAHISRLCSMCCSRDKLISTHTKQQTWAGGGVSACCCVEVLGIPGCGAFNCLEEMWEERCYRKKRKEGGRAQYGAGIFERNSFTLTSSSAQARTV